MMQEKPSSDVSLRDFLSILRRRRATVIQTLVILMVLGVAFTVMTKPVYRTTTQLLVEGKTLTISAVNPNDALNALSTPSTGYDVDTHVEVLQSENVMRDAFEAAKVPYNPELLPQDREAWVTVKQIGETNVVELDVDSHKPEYASRMAREIPKVYLKYITGNSSDEVTRALKWAKKQLEDENAKLDMAQEKLDRFRRGRGIIDQNAELNMRTSKEVAAENDVRKAQADVASAQARLDSLQIARKAMPSVITSHTVSSNTMIIEQEKTDLARLKADRVSKLQLYKPNSVPIQQDDAQIAAAQERLDKTPAMVENVVKAPNTAAIQAADDKITDAQATLASAKDNLAVTQAQLDGIKAELGKLNDVAGTQAKYQREVDQHTAAVTSLAKNVDDLSMKLQANHDPVMTISPPTRLQKVAPRPLLNMVLATLFGLILGVSLAMLQEYMDDRINEPEDAQRLLQAPALGYVPLVQREESRLIADLTGGSTLESYRVLRSNVQFATVDGPISSVMVTSTVPGEGKSVTACNLAVAMALDGRQVILVDADLRRPTIHEKLKLKLQPGLTNVLLGRQSLDTALQPTSIDGLRVLASGPLPPNPAELLNSRAMRQLHDELKTHAEIVIFDTPPCLATADAQVLASFADGVLYVIHLGQTKRSAVRHAEELLRQAHARVLGVVFNKIDLSANRSSYYYSQYGYYSSEISSKKNGHHQNGNAQAVVKHNGAELPKGTASKSRANEDSEEV